MSDPINPDHYRRGGIEAVDASTSMAEGWESPEAEQMTLMQAHQIITAHKYIWRAPFKDGIEKNVRKAIWYLRMSIGDDPRKDRAEIETLP